MPLLPDTLWYRVVVTAEVPLMGQIDLFEIYWYLVGQCANKLLRNNTKNTTINIK